MRGAIKEEYKMSRARRLPSGNWRVNQYIGKDGNGKRIYKSFTAETKRAAELAAAEYVAGCKRSASSITVGDAIDRYIECKSAILSPTTIRGYRVIRKHHLTKLMPIRIDSLTREMVQKAINDESMTSGAKTVSNVYGLLTAAVTMQNPELHFHITLPRKVKRLKNDLPTAEDVIRATKGSPIEIQVMLAMCLCLRMSEVRAVRKSAVHGDKLSIDRVIVPVNGVQVVKSLAKTDATRRYVKLPSFLKDAIMASETDYLTTLTGQAIYARFVRLMKKAGFDGVRFHDLRHIAASDMHRLGITDRVAAERGGWAGTQTMQRVYQHTFSTDRESADKIVSDYYEKIINEINKEIV